MNINYLNVFTGNDQKKSTKKDSSVDETRKFPHLLGFLLEPKCIIENESSNLLPNKNHPRGKTRHAKKEIKTRKKLLLAVIQKKCNVTSISQRHYKQVCLIWNNEGEVSLET